MAPPNNLPVLYSFRRCPYAMRARLALYISSIAVELREIVLRDKPAHMLEISSKGTVPVLQLADHTVIDESIDIMIYALGRQDPDEWLNGDTEDARKLIVQSDNDFKHALDRYKYPDRYPDEDCTDMFERGADILKDMNARITKNECLIEDYDTLADFAIFPFIRQFRNVDPQRFSTLQLTSLEKWLERHLDSALFNAVMEKYKPWEDGDTPIIFGA